MFFCEIYKTSSTHPWHLSPPLVPKHAPLAPENAPLAPEHALLVFEQIQEEVFPFLQTSSDGFDFCDPFNSFGANPVETVKVKMF
jgi:hypothetical protein